MNILTTEQLQEKANTLKSEIVKLLLDFEQETGFIPTLEDVIKSYDTKCQTYNTHDLVIKLLFKN